MENYYNHHQKGTSIYKVFYVRYSLSVGRIPSVSAYYGKEKTNIHLKRKLGKDAESGLGVNCENHHTITREAFTPNSEEKVKSGRPRNTS